jgi:two-component system NarL family sensor kinase
VAARPGDTSPEALAAHAVGEAERIVAWLRLAVLVLLATGHSLPHPNHRDQAFAIALVVYGAFAAGVLAQVSLKGASRRLAVVTTGVDVAAVTTLAALSGGPFSQARLAYFLIPVAVALRFRPVVTAIAAITVVTAYLAQGFTHPAGGREAARFLLVQAGYLLWVGLASVAGSVLLARRTRREIALAEQRARLLTDALSAEERERKRLSEAIHDGALQSMLSARHAIEEAQTDVPHPALELAETELARTAGELRETIFELHPYILEEAGLDAAVAAVARRAAARGGFVLDLRLEQASAGKLDHVLYACARELLANAAQHAAATEVRVALRAENGAVELEVADDGHGFDPATVGLRVAQGHIGLASQRARVEASGGSFRIVSMPGSGTSVTVRVPKPAR